MVAGTVSRLRPPWFETMMPDAPDLTAFSTWSGSNIPLSRMGPLEKERCHSTSFQVQLSALGTNPSAVLCLPASFKFG